MLKRLFLALLFLPVAFLILDPAETLLSRMLRLDQPVSHQIQRGEYLSKLAKEYYGDYTYWRELALVNRAPNADYVLPGERVLIPEFESIRRIREAHTLTQVNEAVLQAQTRLVSEPSPATGSDAATSDVATVDNAAEREPATPAATDAEMSSPNSSQLAPPGEAQPPERTKSSSTWFWAILIPAMAILVVGGTVIWRRRRAGRQEQSAYTEAMGNGPVRRHGRQPGSDRFPEGEGRKRAETREEAEAL